MIAWPFRQVKIRVSFAAPAGTLVRGHVLRRERSCCPHQSSPRIVAWVRRPANMENSRFPLAWNDRALWDADHCASGTMRRAHACGLLVDRVFPAVFTSTTPPSAIAPPSREISLGTSPSQIAQSEALEFMGLLIHDPSVMPNRELER